MPLSEEQIWYIKSKKQVVKKLAKKFKEHLVKFLNTQHELFKISRQLEWSFDEIGNTGTPIQWARFLMYVDWIKWEKELSVFSLWGLKKGAKIEKKTPQSLNFKEDDD